MTNKVIELSELLVDTNNPRIVDILKNQNDVIRAVASTQNKKLVRLANDIIEHGLNPTDLLLVMPFDNTKSLYVVLEGNRRIAALKILENPETIRGAVDNSTYEHFKKSGQSYLESPITAINCIVADTREEAYHWIELKHTGQNEGAGIVPWGAAEAERFRRRSGQKTPHIQILDFLEVRNYISKETKQDVPVSSLRRLISTPYVREKLGIEIQDGRVTTKLGEDEVAKGLKKVAEDLASRRTRTGDIYYAKDRIEYIDSLDSTELPDLSKATPESSILEETVKTKASKPTTTPRSKPSRRKRSTLIPVRGFALRIGQSRINEIYHELRSLNINNYTNAVSVLFRVFLELSLDEYIDNNHLSIDIMSKLSAKMNEVGSHLKDQGKINDQQLKPVRRAAQRDSFLGATITTMHQYIHNQHFHPAPQDLISAWDSLQSFLEAIWK